jgi:peptide/nickel transport system substrate-binding protein
VLGILVLATLAFACARGDKTAAPAAAPAPAKETPKATPAPTASPAPAAAPSSAPTTPAAPVAAPAPAALAGPQPLVPGAPVYDRPNIEKTKFWGYWNDYHQTKLPLWTKAKYGGELVSVNQWLPTVQFNALKNLGDHRSMFYGTPFNIDMGLCSLQGRDDDFSVCKGKYANNYNRIITPAAFVGWSQPTPTTYVFNIRKGVMWPAVPPMARADREMTSADVVWWLGIIKKEGALAPYFTLVNSIEEVDRYTVKVTLSQIHAEFMVNMANMSLALFAKECYDEKDCLVNKSISPSPFLLKVDQPRILAVFEKNPEFYLKGMPYLDGFRMVGITDVAAQKAAFISGKVDSLESVQQPADMENLKKQVPGMRVIAATIFNGQAMRPQLQGPLADVRVRRALTMTMDHRTMWEVMYQGYAFFPTLVARHYFGDEFFMSVEQAGENYQFNPTKAKQLLVEAGLPDGFTTTITTAARSGPTYDMILYLQSQWKKQLGVTVNLKQLDTVAATAALYAGQWEGLYPLGCYIPGCWGGGDEPFLQMLKGAPLNFQKIDDAKIEALYLKQRGELDPAKRAALLWEYEQYELTQIYAVRYSGLMSFVLFQPWSMNCATQQVTWCGNTDSPTAWEMFDPAKYPGKR